MGGRDDERLKGGTKGDSGRRNRLAAELRQNLKRRKAKDRALEFEGNDDPGKRVAPHDPAAVES